MKLINRSSNFGNIFIHMFKNVNKSYVLQYKFKIFKIIKYDLNNKQLLTFYT